jgi:alpha-1,6-mannosyltransferase
LANAITASSGGLRTALRELGAGYQRAGHEAVLISPGRHWHVEETGQGSVITLPGPVVPLSGGYRLVTARRPLRRLLEDLAPDRLEVSDRTTLRWTGAWARDRGIPSVMVSHETLEGLVRHWGPPGAPARLIADRLNRATAAAFDLVVCTTEWSASEFHRLGVTNVVRVPLGVDLARFGPSRYDAELRASLAAPDQPLLVHCSRLSSEKCPERPIEVLAELRRRGVSAALVVVGDGPRRGTLREMARGLPVTFAGYVEDHGLLTRLLATADIAIAPGPFETFGLGALEELASGTPVVVSGSSALPEVVGDAGEVATDTAADFTDAVQRLLAVPAAVRRRAARARAEVFDWQSSIDGFLRAHQAPASVVPDVLPERGTR